MRLRAPRAARRGRLAPMVPRGRPLAPNSGAVACGTVWYLQTTTSLCRPVPTPGAVPPIYRPGRANPGGASASAGAPFANRPQAHEEHADMQQTEPSRRPGGAAIGNGFAGGPLPHLAAAGKQVQFAPLFRRDATPYPPRLIRCLPLSSNKRPSGPEGT